MSFTTVDQTFKQQKPISKASKTSKTTPLATTSKPSQISIPTTPSSSKKPGKTTAEQVIMSLVGDDDDADGEEALFLRKPTPIATTGKRKHLVVDEEEEKGEEEKGEEEKENEGGADVDDELPAFDNPSPVARKGKRPARITQTTLGFVAKQPVARPSPAKRARPAFAYDESTGLAVLLTAHEKLRVDVAVVVLGVGATKYTSKNCPFRAVTICDPSFRKTTFTLWGDKVMTFRFKVGDAVRIKGAEVRYFDGMPQLRSVPSTRTQPDPDARRGEYLREWWTENSSAYFTQLYLGGSVQLISLREAHERAIAAPRGSASYSFVKVSLQVAGNEVAYTACRACDKKVTKPEGSDAWYCIKCQKEVDDTCVRYLVRVEAREGAFVVPMTVFDNVGRALFGIEAGDLLEDDPDNVTKYDDAIGIIENYRYAIRCSGKIVKLEKGERIDFQILDVLMKELIPEEEREAWNERGGSSEDTTLGDVEDGEAE